MRVFGNNEQFLVLFGKYLPMQFYHNLDMSKYKKNTQFLEIINQESILHDTKGQCFWQVSFQLSKYGFSR